MTGPQHECSWHALSRERHQRVMSRSFDAHRYRLLGSCALLLGLGLLPAGAAARSPAPAGNSALPGAPILVRPPLSITHRRLRPIRAAAVAGLPRRAALGPARRVGWGAGEALTFEVRLAGIEAARSALSVGRPLQRAGRTTLKLRAMGETIPFIAGLFPMSEEQVTTADLAGVLPLRSTSRRTMRERTRRVMTRHGPLTEQVMERAGQRSTRRRRMPTPLLDPLTALYLLRSLPLKSGTELTLHVLAGTALYRVALRVGGRERVHSRLGPRDCVLLAGEAQRIFDNGRKVPGRTDRKVTLWLTDDEARIPLRMQGDSDIGYLDVHISGYTPPGQRLALRAARLPSRPVPAGAAAAQPPSLRRRKVQPSAMPKARNQSRPLRP